MKTRYTRIFILVSVFVLVCVVGVTGQRSRSAQLSEQHNMRLVGYHDLQGRSAYQPVIQEQAGRWIAYVGHHTGREHNPHTGRMETNGTSILDVTNPAHPVYLHHIPGASGAQTTSSWTVAATSIWLTVLRQAYILCN